MDLQLILTIIAALVGTPLLWALLIDVLKWAGIVQDGDAGKWSAVFNLVTLIVVAIVINFFPQADVAGIDAQLKEFVEFGILVFGYVTQIVGTKGFHKLLASKGIGYTHTH